MPWLRRQSPWVWTASVLGMVAFGIALGLVTSLFPGAPQADQLTAAAALLGGFIGAAGTALAVYLTLASQRSDEAQKVEAALRIEVSEQARLAHGLLGLCELVLVKGDEIPLRDLPALMYMPDATVFKATADRISRLAYGPLFVVMHSRIAEALQMVRIYAVTGSPPEPSGPGRIADVRAIMESRRLLDKEKAKTLATAWFDVCEVARAILTRDPSGFEIAEASVAEVLKDLEAVRTRVPPLIEEARDPS
jgi:hypothetical protein